MYKIPRYSCIKIYASKAPFEPALCQTRTDHLLVVEDVQVLLLLALLPLRHGREVVVRCAAVVLLAQDTLAGRKTMREDDRNDLRGT